MADILLEAFDLYKAYGDRTVLDIDRLSVYDGDRIGLIGENGMGKSTLIKILSGELEPDGGRVVRSCEMSVIAQFGDVEGVLAGEKAALFGAPDQRDTLSGGEKTRRRIAGALTRGTSLLLADEPTTDLDLKGIELLKKQLLAHRGALLLVSHDRALLDLLCRKIWHLEDGHITEFAGGYTQYREELENRRQFQQFEYEQYREEKARLLASAQRLAEKSQQVKKAPSRMGNSEARLHKREWTDAVIGLSHRKSVISNRVERLEEKERPRDLPNIRMELGARTPIPSSVALRAKGLSCRAGDRLLFKTGELMIPTGSRTAILGDNGAGKTTLLRALFGRVPDGIRMSGSIKMNPAVKTARFDQDHADTMDQDKSALENAMYGAVQDESVVRTVFARLNMRGDSVFKPFRVLSGGERAKTALVKLMVSDANVLVLDEPTNHLDVFTMDELENLLKDYRGTLVFVSHDRAFIEHVATRLLVLDGGDIGCFEGTLAEREARLSRDDRREELKIQITTLEMRLSLLAGRMAQPKKGDRPEQLAADYEALLPEIRSLKKELEELK